MHIAGAAGDLLLRRSDRRRPARRTRRRRRHGDGNQDEASLSETLRPFRVIAGLVLSFSVVTLAGSALLSLLHLPQDALRWVGIVALTAIGVGLIFPKVEELLEKPFTRIPQFNASEGRSGFGLGLALGVLFVPCAGPVLAAIVLAGATGTIGVGTIVLTLCFAIGTAIPLLIFALAGRRVAERVGAFRRHQRRIRIVGGVVMIALAVASRSTCPPSCSAIVPDYTSPLQDKVGGTQKIAERLNLGGLVNEQNKDLDNCTNGGPALESCGTAPDITGIAGWLNTPGDTPVELEALRGQGRAGRLLGLLLHQLSARHPARHRLVRQVQGRRARGHRRAHSRVRLREGAGQRRRRCRRTSASPTRRARQQPVDWTNYRNRYWPAEYLIDAIGTVRHIKFGEGDYDVTEDLIRQLLTEANPGIALPPPSDSADITPQAGQTPETYLSVGKVVNYGGPGVYDKGDATFAYPAALPNDAFALQGPWALDYQGATSGADTSSIELNYNAKNVYLVAGGQGTATVIRDGKTTTIPIGGPPTSHQLVAGEHVQRGSLEVRLSKGLQAFSFTYG